MKSKLRVGLFPFLNVQPLVHVLRDQPDIELILDLPARIADRYRAGELDLAMVPSFEAAFLDATIVDSICISSDGPVETVMLHHRVPLALVKTLALDEASRTSAALSKILIAGAAGRLPICRSFSPIRGSAPDSDAILVIGDPAFHFSRPGFDAMDLGTTWRDQEALPFVFALMVANRSADALPDGLSARLRAAIEKGRQSVPTIARSYTSGVDAARAERYLRSVIRYDLGPKEKEGLRRFYFLAEANGLLHGAKELQFHAF